MYLLPGCRSRSGHNIKPLLSWVRLLLNPMSGIISACYFVVLHFPVEGGGMDGGKPNV